jgi:hypothetical protein
MEFEEWERHPPSALRGGPLWRMAAYRLSLFAVSNGWADVTRLERRMIARSLADQLYRALGSIGANIADGYGRASGRDRVRFFEYASVLLAKACTGIFQRVRSLAIRSLKNEPRS